MNQNTYLIALSTYLIIGCAKLPSDSTYTIAANVSGDKLTLTTSQSMAGAIQSINWRGQEFLNAYDHGREMQTDIRIGLYGECYNPTEAGSRTDKEHSSSILKSIVALDNKLSTETQLGLWLAPNDNYIVNCPLGTRTPRTTTLASNDIVRKQIVIGAFGYDNIIQVDEQYYIAEDFGDKDWLFEGLVAFMNPSFTKMYQYGRSDFSLVPIVALSGVNTEPVVFATPDGQYAISSFMALVPLEAFTAFNGYQRSQDGYGGVTGSWSNTFYTHGLRIGWYSFRTYVVVGTLAEVHASLDVLNTILTKNY